jgi:8-amino-7-oxononanoate synthase
MAFDFIAAQLAEQKDKARYRQRTCISQQMGSKVLIDGNTYLNFSSNDYLGLNDEPLLKQAMQEGLDRFGLAATGSSLLTGYHYAHQALEQQICEWLNKPKCLLLSSGFAANLAVLHSLGQDKCLLLLDKLSHASLIDGALSSKASVKRFLHNDMAQLARQLQKSESANNLIVSEGVFSMDGDQAQVAKLATLAAQYNAWLYLDDAHSIGVVGATGQGSASQAKVDIVMATFGKAIATSGAFVACENPVFDHLVNFSRHYIYSTAISPAMAWATHKSIELIQKQQWRRDKIVELSALFTQLIAPSVEMVATQSSIHALVIGDEVSALSLSEKLKQKGIWLTAIRPPTVPVNQSRLRVTICANHSSSDIRYLAKCINALND